MKPQVATCVKKTSLRSSSPHAVCMGLKIRLIMVTAGLLAPLLLHLVAECIVRHARISSGALFVYKHDICMFRLICYDVMRGTTQ